MVSRPTCVVGLIHNEERARRDGGQEAASNGFRPFDAVHLVVSRKHYVGRRLAVVDSTHVVGRLLRRLRRRERTALRRNRLPSLLGCVALGDPFERGVIQGNSRTRIGHHHVDVAPKLFVPANVVQVAPHIAVQVGLFRHENRDEPLPLRIGNHRGDDAPLADPGLVADDKAFALLNIRYAQADGVDLLGAEILAKFALRAPERLRHVIVNRPLHALQAIQRLVGGVAQVRRQQRIEFDALLRGWFVTDLPLIGFCLYSPPSVGNRLSIRLPNVSIVSGCMSFSVSQGID